MPYEEIHASFRKNISRVENLISLYKSQAKPHGKGRKPAKLLDILRAATVFLHAALEDVLRSVELIKLPDASAGVLEEISLIGKSPAKKYSLGDLVAMKGKLVDDVIKESVQEHLLRSNYNSTSQIADVLKKIGIDISKVNKNFDEIGKLMARRHQIVHRADIKSAVKGSGDHKVNGINSKTVQAWMKAVEEFVESLLKLE